MLKIVNKRWHINLSKVIASLSQLNFSALSTCLLSGVLGQSQYISGGSNGFSGSSGGGGSFGSSSGGGGSVGGGQECVV